MHFIKVTSPEPVVDQLVANLKGRLGDGESVLWLVAGGSTVALAVEVAKRLRDVPLDRLTFTLVDERYGEVGHADSIWQQLLEGGLDLPGAKMLPVLTGLDRDAEAERWGRELDGALKAADYRVALLGIGPDGHTAGILPHSPAVDAAGTAFAYQSAAIPGVRPAFQRITMTRSAIARLDEVIVYAVGESKWPVLDQLAAERPLDEQPAQMLKAVKNLTIYNDHRGEAA